MREENASLADVIYCCKATSFMAAPVRELLSNNSPFVGQLYEDKSVALRALDLIFFTTDPK